MFYFYPVLFKRWHSFKTFYTRKNLSEGVCTFVAFLAFLMLFLSGLHQKNHTIPHRIHGTSYIDIHWFTSIYNGKINHSCRLVIPYGNMTMIPIKNSESAVFLTLPTIERYRANRASKTDDLREILQSYLQGRPKNQL